ncbi:hypothetical protein BJX62DRAFT_9348 [Aspergillus germanicus]
MPTPLDRAMNSKNLVLGFAGMVTAAAVWAIWGNEMFPAESDPQGDPANWTLDEMHRWLRADSCRMKRRRVKSSLNRIVSTAK